MLPHRRAYDRSPHSDRPAHARIRQNHAHRPARAGAPAAAQERGPPDRSRDSTPLSDAPSGRAVLPHRRAYDRSTHTDRTAPAHTLASPQVHPRPRRSAALRVEPHDQTIFRFTRLRAVLPHRRAYDRSAHTDRPARAAIVVTAVRLPRRASRRAGRHPGALCSIARQPYAMLPTIVEPQRPFPVRRRPAHLPLAEQGNRSSIVLLTVCTARRRPLLASPVAMQILEGCWREADAWLVGRYVIMPDHIHLFCAPTDREAPPLRAWVKFWKSLVSREWPRANEKPLWQRDFWDRQLRSGEAYSERWDYVCANPVRAGLCARSEDWPYRGEIAEFRFHDA